MGDDIFLQILSILKTSVKRISVRVYQEGEFNGHRKSNLENVYHFGRIYLEITVIRHMPA